MNQDTFPTCALVQEVEENVQDQIQESGKRKRQLAALAEGRKKRWLKKQQELERGTETVFRGAGRVH